MFNNIFRKIAKNLLNVDAWKSLCDFSIYTQARNDKNKVVYNFEKMMTGIPCVYREDQESYPNQVLRIVNIFLISAEDLKDFSYDFSKKYKIKYNGHEFNVIRFKELGSVNNTPALYQFTCER